MSKPSANSWLRFWSGRLKDDLLRFRPEPNGSMVVELAFLAPILILLLFSAVELGRAISLQSRLNGAAKAGAIVAVEGGGYSGNATKVTAAAQNAAGNGAGLQVQTAEFCQCPNGTSTPCTQLCSGVKPWDYVSVTVSQPLDVFLPVPFWTQAPTMTASLSMRIP